MKRAALYIRVSTEEQAKHGFSLAEQQHDLEQYARAHHYTVVGVYADEGNTARKALSRRKEETTGKHPFGYELKPTSAAIVISPVSRIPQGDACSVAVSVKA